MKFLFLLFIFLNCIYSNQYNGQVVFYSYSEKSTSNLEQVEIDSDFSFYIDKISRYLDENKIKHQTIHRSDFTIITINGKKLRISKKKIPISTGYIMIKNNGKYLISQGMGTGVDMISEIYKYFKIKEEKNELLSSDNENEIVPFTHNSKYLIDLIKE